MPERKMTEAESVRLLDIRKRGKCARPVSEAEHAFCDAMHKLDRDGYAEVEAELSEWLRSAPWWELIG